MPEKLTAAEIVAGIYELINPTRPEIEIADADRYDAMMLATACGNEDLVSFRIQNYGCDDGDYCGVTRADFDEDATPEEIAADLAEYESCQLWIG